MITRSIFFLCIFLSGCIPVNSIYYLPVLEKYRYEALYCGSVPTGGFYKELATYESVQIDISINEITTSALIIVNTKPGEIVKINGVVFVDESGKHDPVTISNSILSESGRHLMDGEEIASYNLNVHLNHISSQFIRVQIESIIIDDKKYKIDNIRFARTEKSGFMTCIQ